MRTRSIVLILSGIVLVAVAAWLSFIIPIKTKTRIDDYPRHYMEHSDHITIWGTTISTSLKGYDYETDKGSPTAEYHGSGPVMGGLFHGGWECYERKPWGEWKRTTEWFWKGKTVSKEEWERLNRERK